MVLYQCSFFLILEGIVVIFCQCGKLQEGKNLEKFVLVVVFDEVGLVEDFFFMFLKIFYFFFEDGVIFVDDVIEMDEKVQCVVFIGILNWVLDFVKMNCGIMLLCGVLDVIELVDSVL